MMRDNIADFRMWEFAMERNEPVFAIRKGTVIHVEGYDAENGQAGGGTIIVEHADGTQARYASLRSGSALVAPGDTIFPDTPIALAGELRSSGRRAIPVCSYAVKWFAAHPEHAEQLAQQP